MITPPRPVNPALPGPTLDRRGFLVAAGALAAFGAAAGAQDASPAPAVVRRFEDVVALSAARSRTPHEPARQTLAPPLDALTYDQFRGIRYRREAALWQGEGRGFSVDLFHPGFLFQEAVAVHVIGADTTTAIAFQPDRFDYADPALRPSSAEGMSYTGFRLRYPIKSPDVMDEVAVFQGASYFRAVGRRHVYGLSARGLALRTAEPEGEEFPTFTAFWIVEPEPNAASLTVFGLLESPSVTGAMQAVIRPGETTAMDIRLVLHPRTDLSAVGMAPLTSMFWFDASTARRVDDYRPAVHDSNGLQIVNGAGERLWRPLANHRTLQVSAFVDQGPRGFGLVQRGRDFARFEDAEARYDLRPSAWVEPAGDWGPGAVLLVEIPVADEFNDNIVAFWRPRAPLVAGMAHEIAYRLHWTDTPPDDAPIPRVAATRTGAVTGAPAGDPRRLYVIDYAGAAGYAGRAEPRVFASAGTVADVVLHSTPAPDGMRLAFKFDPGDAPMAELRADLMVDGQVAAESWLYRWTA